MRVLLRTIVSSLSQAWGQLTGNKLRTFLSLLGVSIGIFCIVAVQAAVNSMQADVFDSLSKLGDKTFYVQKWPWSFGPDYPWWEYLKRPQPTFDEYVALNERVGDVATVGFYVNTPSPTAKWRSNSVTGVEGLAGSRELKEFFGFEMESGNYITPSEYDRGSNVVVLGHDVAQDLFGAAEAVGREIRLFGQKLLVVGVIEKSGDDMVTIIEFDNTAIIGYPLARKCINVKSDNYGASLMVSPREGTTERQLRDAVTQALRAERRLRPLEKDDFAINNVSILAGFLDSIFGVLSGVGLVVGSFAGFVGAFSVANIMFVSVRERTGLIGVKMALGAARPVILLEFLIESIALCLIGGLVGLGLVLLTFLVLNNFLPFTVALAPGTVMLGLGLAVGIGVLAGIVPAYLASRMDPVTAIRS